MKTKKKTVAKADANARAKELKRARDARYRAKKHAAKTDAKTQTEKPKADANVNAKLAAENRALHEVVTALGLAVLSSELVLIFVACHKGIPADIREAASNAMKIGSSAMTKLRIITKEVK